MKGDIWVRSQYGKGSSFFFTCTVGLATSDTSFIKEQLKPYQGHNVLFIDKEETGHGKEIVRMLPEIGLVPVVVNSERDVTLVRPRKKNASKYDADKAAIRRSALDELIGSVLVDNHDAIKDAWEKNPSLEATGFVPISEPEFMKIAAQWKDPKVATANKDKWVAASTAKFQ